MKKLVLVLAFLGAFLWGQSQTQVSRGQVYTSTIDMSTITGSDTTIYVSFPYSGDWATRISWTGLTGSGTLGVYVSMDGTSWEAYNTSPSTTVTGATGSYAFEDDLMAWTYVGWKLTVSTISVGTLKLELLLK